jgi:beta-galactosidase/beta-glucuronidase
MLGKIQLRIISVVVGIFACVPTWAIPLPSESDHVISLNGTWRFKMEQVSRLKKASGEKMPLPSEESPFAFQKVDYKEDDTWHDMKVPSNWEMLGYSPATYGQPDDSIGLYRLQFDVPAEWKGRKVEIDFDGVQNGAEVFLNGQPVEVHEPSHGRKNYHEAGWDPFQVDLTPAVKFGEKNLLAVRVTKNTQSVDMDTGDYFFLGGIYRNVRLFSVPMVYVDDLTIRTNLLTDDKAEVHVIRDTNNTAKAPSKMTITLEGQPPVETATTETVITVDHPKLWSAEKPNLYNLSLDLKDEGSKVTEHITKRIGIREIAIKGGVFMVNNQPVKLAGICRHEDWATLGSALGDEQWRKDITMMKAANINAIRTSHYPYGSGFYDLCDELGMYVADEMAACWVKTNTDELTPGFQQRAREYVQRDKNHPCIVIWAIGNENAKGKNNRIAADEIRKIDPTRPRLVSCKNADDSGVELDDRHYTPPEKIALLESKATDTPRIFLENPNVWDFRNGADFGNADLWGAVIDRTWKEIWKDKHVPGSFLWEWQDRAVADQCPTKLYDYYPETGIQIVKMKGLVDAFRNPRPALYSVKMAYSPVQIDYAKPVIAGDVVTLGAANFYSFTNFSELKLTCHLLSNGEEKDNTYAHVDLAPMSRGNIKLELKSAAAKTADVLRLDFDWPDGRNVITYDIRLKPEQETAPAHSSDLAGINFPHLNFTTFDMGPGNTGWRIPYRHPGTLMHITATTAKGDGKLKDADLYATSLAEVKSVDADISMDVVTGQPDAGKKFLKKKLIDEAETHNVGHVHVEVNDGHFAYQLTWKDAKTANVQELGWAFAMAKSCDHFSWHRQAYWSYYPPDQIGRAAGAATPDSVDQQMSKMTRVDGFDFDSTKYHCDWASLGGTDGHGIVVICAPDDRQQCRGQIDKDAGYSLVVNKQCSPPEDISSNVVPEFYLKLNPGESAHGSFTVAALQK